MTRVRAWLRLKLGWIPRPVRRIIVGVIGGTLLLLALIGFIMPVMPGFIFLPLGLAILPVEFTWAARWLKKVKRGAQAVRDRGVRGHEHPGMVARQVVRHGQLGDRRGRQPIPGRSGASGECQQVAQDGARGGGTTRARAPERDPTHRVRDDLHEVGDPVGRAQG